MVQLHTRLLDLDGYIIECSVRTCYYFLGLEACLWCSRVFASHLPVFRDWFLTAGVEGSSSQVPRCVLRAPGRALPVDSGLGIYLSLPLPFPVSLRPFPGRVSQA